MLRIQVLGGWAFLLHHGGMAKSIFAGVLTTALALSLSVAVANDMLPQVQPVLKSSAQQGIILLRRTEPVQRPPSPEELDARIQRMADTVVAARKAEILAQASQMSEQQTVKLAEATKRALMAAEARANTFSTQQAESSAQAAADKVALVAENRAASVKDQTLAELTKLREQTEQQLALLEQQSKLYAKEAELNASKVAYTRADVKAAEAEARAKDYASLELRARDAATSGRLEKLIAQNQATADKLQGLLMSTKEQIALRTESLKALTNARLDAVEKTTSVQLAALGDITKSEMARTRDVTGEKIAALDGKTQIQLASLKDVTTAQMGALAESGKVRNEMLVSQINQLKDTTQANITWTRELTKEQLVALDKRVESQIVALDAKQSAKLSEMESLTSEKLDRNREVASMHIASVREGVKSYLAAMDARDTTRAMMTAAKVDAMAAATETKLAEAEGQNALRHYQSQQRLEDLEQLTASNQKLMRAETNRVAEALATYADQQIAALANNVSHTIARVAEAGDIKVSDLKARTDDKIQALRNEATQKAVILTQQTQERLTEKLTEVAQTAEAKRLKPEQVKQIASATVTESAPQMRALALQTLAKSQDYIRTVARTAVLDKDPQMTKALAQAARDVVMKDDKIVFAIRKVVDARLARLPMAGATGSAASTQPNGVPTIYNGNEVSLDAKRLGVAPIGADLAAIEPAAGGLMMDGAKIATLNTKPSLMKARQRKDWVDLRKYRVVVHEDGKTLQQLVGDVVSRAEPYTGPWEIKWKVRPENKDILSEKFSLDAETTFEEFVNYLANYMVNERGIKLSFSLFDTERVLVISD